MPLEILGLILVSVSLSALAQTALKAGMSGDRIARSLAGGAHGRTVLAVATTWPVLLGLGMYGLGAVLWLFVLARIDVSQAYPFVGLGFLLTMALGALLLKERLGARRMVGTALVALGVGLVALS